MLADVFEQDLGLLVHLDQDDLARAAVEHRRARNRQHITARMAAEELDVAEHRGLEQPTGVGQLDAYLPRARFRIDRRIDERDLSGD